MRRTAHCRRQAPPTLSGDPPADAARGEASTRIRPSTQRRISEVRVAPGSCGGLYADRSLEQRQGNAVTRSSASKTDERASCFPFAPDGAHEKMLPLTHKRPAGYYLLNVISRPASTSQMLWPNANRSQRLDRDRSRASVLATSSPIATPSCNGARRARVPGLPSCVFPKMYKRWRMAELRLPKHWPLAEKNTIRDNTKPVGTLGCTQAVLMHTMRYDVACGGKDYLFKRILVIIDTSQRSQNNHCESQRFDQVAACCANPVAPADCATSRTHGHLAFAMCCGLCVNLRGIRNVLKTRGRHAA